MRRPSRPAILRSMSKASLWLAATVLLLSACAKDPVAEGGTCEASTECAQGLKCRSKVCSKPQVAAPVQPAPASDLVEPIRKAKRSEKTAQDGVDKRMKEILGE